MRRFLGHVPVQHIEGADGVEVYDLFEKVEAVVTLRRVRKVRDRRLAPARACTSAFRKEPCPGTTHGHEMIATNAMPAIMALLTLYDIR